MRVLMLPFQLRYLTLTIVLAVFAASVAGVLYLSEFANWFAIPAVVFGILSVWGLRDLLQRRHAILRNYPLIAQMRFFFESIRPEMRQYFFEDEKDGMPFSRDKRAIVYQRSKRQLDKRPFGTQYDVYDSPYEWLHHSVSPADESTEPFRLQIGGPDCRQPYSASIYNISGMSFGALSPNAIRALNIGAKKGNFAHTTGEGGISRYHSKHGGDLIWQIGSGYFGCRKEEGGFCPERFAETAALDQVRMIEIKLSQGAKPGHGGVLPKAKISREIARTRGVPRDRDCVSPARHPAFSTPIELLAFISQLRELSGGKPIGFKLCIGQPVEFLSICKAMVETGITPDFIVVDGAEGGTGAAPLEFADHLGMPLREALNFVHNSLVGAGLRDRIRVGASGKVISAFDIARVMALGADWCNAARGFMFALGCIQSQHCHTDECPTGVATQAWSRQRALVVPDKSERVYHFHRSTMESLAELVAAMGLKHPSQIQPEHISRRISGERIATFAELFPALRPGELLEGTDNSFFAETWAKARPDMFSPVPEHVMESDARLVSPAGTRIETAAE